MRKSYFKLLAVFLAVMMLVSTMPMAALAVEVDTHDHADCDCATSRSACTHSQMYASYDNRVTSMTAAKHTVKEYAVYTCATCGYSYSEATGNVFTENHIYVMPNGGISAACLVCGYA